MISEDGLKKSKAVLLISKEGAWQDVREGLWKLLLLQVPKVYGIAKLG